MTSRDVTITSSKPCSTCEKKMHHGYTATAISNAKGKIKAYCCGDKCVNEWIEKHHSVAEPLTVQQTNKKRR